MSDLRSSDLKRQARGLRAPLFAAALALMVAPLAGAGVPEALNEHILPGLAGFSESAEALAVTAGADCTAETVRPAYQAAFDAWTVIGDIRIGPSETGVLSVAFWPDTRGFTAKGLREMIAAEAPEGRDPAAFAEASIAVRGLFALERLLYDDAFSGYAQGSYTCDLVQTVAQEMAQHASGLSAAWQDNFAEVLTSAGEPGNATYMTRDEAVRALYTQVLTSLEMTADNRLGRPLGTFDRPRPARAEAWRAGRSLRNVLLETDAAVDLARGLADWDLPQTEAALTTLHEIAGRVTDPTFQRVDDPMERLRVEIVQQQVRAVRDAIELEIGVRLGMSPGFNSADGD